MKSDEGHSLIEVLVALVILSIVVVGSISFLGFLANNPMQKDKMIALNLGRSEMEQTLFQKTLGDTLYVVDNRFWVKRTSLMSGDLAHIQVRVHSRDTTSAPLIELETSRLWYVNFKGHDE